MCSTSSNSRSPGFAGANPNQHRYNIEQPALDSVSTRLNLEPDPGPLGPGQLGYLHQPEQLEPDVNENRITASFTYNKPLGDGNNWRPPSPGAAR